MIGSIIVFIVSGLIFQIFLNIFAWIFKRNANFIIVSRILARLAACCFCTIFFVISHIIAETEGNKLSALAPIISIILCNGTVLLLNKFLADNSIGSEFTYFMHGFILAMAVYFLTANAWSTAATLFIQFIEGYIGYDFRNKKEREDNKQKDSNSFVKPLALTLINFAGILLVFFIFPSVDTYIGKHKMAAYLAWIILSVIHIINYGGQKCKRKHNSSIL